jgi:phytoene dehydrogenase-like protein
VTKFDAVIIGAGHNGLVTAAYLAKAGKRVLVLERRPVVGGIAVSEEIYPGFKYATCAHLCGSFSRQITKDLELEKHGLKILPLDPSLFAPLPDGRSLIIPRAAAKMAGEIGRFSPADAEKFDSFSETTAKLAKSLSSLLGTPMPDGAARPSTSLAELARVGWKLHRLGSRDLQEFLRVVPMSIADYLNEWFETDLLKAALAGSGLLGAFVGPRQQGTAYAYLHQLLGETGSALRTSGFVQGGIGHLTQAIAQAAERYGAEIRTDSEVERVATEARTATGVVFGGGTEVSAAAVISNVDIKRTFLKLVEPTYLDPRFLLHVRNIRSRGVAAKINLALDRLPHFNGAGANGSAAHLGGVIHIGPTIDYLERASDDAKYGRFSKQPFLEITIPSLADPSLAPDGKHVMSIWMQYAPYHIRESAWHQQRDTLGDRVVNLLNDYAPGFKNAILHRQVLTPVDLEETFGLTEGHIYHGELALDQIFFMRPLPGWARYRTPIENFYLCGSGTHPGGAISGLPGYMAARQILKDAQKRG